jgi:hypothetical protein
MGMRFCSRCGVSLDAGFPQGPMIGDTVPITPPIATGQTAVAIAPAVPQTHYAHEPEYYPSPAYYAARPRRRHRFLRFLLIGLLSGVLVAAALVGLELATRGPGNAPPDRIALVRHDYPAAGYSVEVPDGWRVRHVTVGGRPVNSFIDPKQTPDGHRRRGLNVSTDQRPLETMVKLLKTEAGSTANETYTAGLSVGGRQAVRLAVDADDLHFDRWWVDNGKRTWRIEFYSTLGLQEETSVLEDRIIDSFVVL